jgi:hypothetical protein
LILERGTKGSKYFIFGKRKIITLYTSGACNWGGKI